MPSIIDSNCDAAVAANRQQWFLHGWTTDDKRLREIPLRHQRLLVGRRPDSDLCLSQLTVSGSHAELVLINDTLFVRDLKSRNGTFVNGRRIHTDVTLHPGDLIQFGGVEFRVIRKCEDHSSATLLRTSFEVTSRLLDFERLLNEPAVIPFFQPIIELQGGQTIAFEVLARSRIPGLKTPGEMFPLAEQMGLERELSVVCREMGIKLGASLPDEPRLYLNTHPAEMEGSGLIQSLADLRTNWPTQPISLEIHEAAVTDLANMQDLQTQLRELNIALVYDDFGSGQARLLDLAEVPPACLKFDICLVRGIHQASAQRQQMIATLVRMVREFGTVPLAEGVETAEEANTCRELGFELAQGYFFGKPAPADTFRTHAENVCLT